MSITPISNQFANIQANPYSKNIDSKNPTFKAVVPKVNPVEVTNTLRNSSGRFFEPVRKFLEPAKKYISKKYDKIIDWGAEKVIAPITNSKIVQKFGEKTGKIDNMPCHLSTLGAAVTSSFYVQNTLKNENLKKKERRTLAINQVLVWCVSTLGAYTVNNSIDAYMKKVGYKFRELNQGNPALSTRMKGFKTAQSLLVFAMMYRYVSPVIVTPIASKIGQWINKDVK